MPLMASTAIFMPSAETEKMLTVPSSSMSISQPDSSTRRLMFLPPGPMIAPIYGVHGNLHALRRDGEDVDRAIVLDVNFAAGFLDEALDVLATGSDDRADLLGVDLERGDARGVFADFLAWLGNGLGHFTENREAGDAGFFHGNFHDGMRQAFQLQVELEAGDAFFRAGNFAVHVAIRVF